MITKMKNKMKKIAVLFALVSAINVVVAQNENRNSFIVGANVGIINYVNYPAVSVFADGTERYVTPFEMVEFGYRYKNFAFGAQWRFSTLYTSQYDFTESMMHNEVGIFTRAYKPINEMFELFGGLKLIGISFMNNVFEYDQETYNFSRMGIGCEFELGVVCNISSSSYLGFRVSVSPLSSNFEEDIELPLAYRANSRSMFNNYNISVSYGIKF